MKEIASGVKYLNRQSSIDYLTSRNSIFEACLVTIACRDVGGLRQFKDNIVNWIAQHELPGTQFSYWTVDTKIPNDLDDTLNAIHAITTVYPEWLNGERTANLMKILISSEKHPGGPYKTWLTSNQNWTEYDSIVNANIGSALASLGVETPKLKAWFKGRPLQSKYYTHPTVQNYFLSKFVPEYVRPKLDFGHPLYAALSLSTMLNKAEVQTDTTNKLADYICKSQNSDGSWPKADVYIESTIGGVKYVGSDNLTTAYCLEALDSYSRIDKIHLVNNGVVTSLRQIIDTLPTEELRAPARITLDQLVETEARRSIQAMPERVATAAEIILSKEQLQQIQMISLLGWLAYTLFDDILDHDKSVINLPTVICVLRELNKAVTTIVGSDSELRREIDSLFMRMDVANNWELTNARNINALPDYGDLSVYFNRSAGHAISGLLVIWLGDKEELIKPFKEFMKHYIIARQLSDDAHDWEDDLRAGRATAVVCMILRQTNTSEHDDIHELQSVAWSSIMPEVCDMMEDHCSHAELATTAFGNASCLLKLLKPVRDTISKTRSERTRVIEFMQSL